MTAADMNRAITLAPVGTAADVTDGTRALGATAACPIDGVPLNPAALA